MFSPLRGTRFHSRHHKNDAAKVKRPSRHTLQIERLEHRLLLANDPIVVDTAEDIIADDGVTSLREAVIEANARDGADVIQFAESFDGRRMSFSIAETRAGAATTGDLDITDDLTIEGRGVKNTIISAGGIDRVFDLHGEIVVTISGTKIRGGQASDGDGGGGILNRAATLSLFQSEISGNSSDSSGGGIHNEGTIKSIHQTTISKNKAVGAGGGIANYGEIESISLSTLLGNQAGWGGAIYSRGAIESISQSTISGNMADNTGGAIRNSGWIGQISGSTISGNSADDSGAINNGGSIGSISQTTISGNTASNDAGAIDNYGTIGSIRQTTITGNSGGDSGGISNGGIIARMESTIIAGNGIHGTATPDLRGRMIRMANNNLIGSSQGHTISDGVDGNIIGVDPMLGPLADNGGPTLTHALLPGSPAIDAGANPDILEFDQRGEPYIRVFGNTPDIGAIEFQRTNVPIIVDTARDIIADDGKTSLREAIIEANETIGADVIQFGESSSLLPIILRIQGKDEDTAATGDLDITDDLTIEGLGTGTTIIDADGLDRVLDLHGDITVTLSGLTIRNGSVSDNGGGILNRDATLSLFEMAIIGNRSEALGSALFNSGTIEIISQSEISDNRSDDRHHTLYNDGTINHIDQSSFSNNVGRAIENPGSIGRISESVFSENTANSGGGIRNSGTISSISQTTFSNNSVTSQAGAISNEGTIDSIFQSTFSGNTSSDSYGAIRNEGTIGSISESWFTGNIAFFRAGAIGNSGTINSISETTFSGNVASIDRGGAIDNVDAIGNISRSTFVNNAASFGGAISNNGFISSIRGSVLSGNVAEGGGAIINGGTIGDISESTLSGNTSDSRGGAIRNSGVIESINRSSISDNTAWSGGAIYNRGWISSIDQATISNNTARDGGAIYNRGWIDSISQSTISGNTASRSAGAIHNRGRIESISQSTITGNYAYGSGGILLHSTGAIGTLESTIIAGNNTSFRFNRPDLSDHGTIVSAKNNLIGSSFGHTITDGANGNIVGVDPMLGPLADNGGPTLTHALLPGSPAIDAGSHPSFFQFDQRGVPFRRSNGLGVDIGAFEYVTPIIVDTVRDVISDDGKTSLREAIIEANETFGADVIQFAESSHSLPIKLRIQGKDEDAAATGDLDITDDLTIEGLGTGTTIIDADGLDRVLDLHGDITVTLSGLTIRDGHVSDNGGGILNRGATLSLFETEIIGNRSAARGSGVYNGGTIEIISQTTVSENRSDSQQHAIYNDGEINHIDQSSISNNFGGAIKNVGTIGSMSESSFAENTANSGGAIQNSGTIGRIYENAFTNNISLNRGGAIENKGTINSISESIISGNTSVWWGGAIHNYTRAVIGDINQVSISGNFSSGRGGGGIDNYGTIGNISESAISGNTAHGSGGAIMNRGVLESINRSSISGNTAGRSGGIHNYGTIGNISESAISGNTAHGSGGAITNFGVIESINRSSISGNTASSGGAIENHEWISNISRTTIAGNTARKTGAIYNCGWIDNISHSTISGNTAFRYAGAIYNRGRIESIRQSTITGNSGYSGGGILQQSTGSIGVLESNVIADNSSFYQHFRPDLDDSGTIVNATHNLIGSSSGHTIADGANGNIVGVDPMLGPLADNGGPTWTHALLPGSPAIDTGSNPLMLEFDQRGEPFVREFGGIIDIGAFELQREPVVAIPFTEQDLRDALLSSVGESAYRAELDLDDSGMIDIRDLQIFRPLHLVSPPNEEPLANLAASESFESKPDRHKAREQVFASLADGELTPLLPASWL